MSSMKDSQEFSLLNMNEIVLILLLSLTDNSIKNVLIK